MDIVNFIGTVSLISTIFSYSIAQLTIRAASHYCVDCRCSVLLQTE